MLIGEYSHNLDTKGRVSIPSKFRDDLGGTFVLAKGVNDCLAAYSKNEWEHFQEELLALKGADGRRLRRFFFSGATECEIDAQGRILIPPILRTYANLSREVTIAGVSDHMEIWNKEDWDKYMNAQAMSPKEVEDAMERLGL
ncbi:MAG: division/cell wall cluster transcriptional repressor MraZ [Clostridia bacterium]|nr:division/cell wall cluster transcriptional repressor MraZ [Clostridia bacterium]